MSLSVRNRIADSITTVLCTEMPCTDTNEPATGQGFYKIDVELE